MTAPHPAVVLCSDLAGDGRTPGEIREALSIGIPGLAITIVDHLCERPTAAAAAMRAAGCTRVVVGVCRRRVPSAELRARARRNGSGAYGVAIVRVPRTRGVAAAAATLAAAVERLTAMPPGEPSRKVATHGGQTRGALLRLAPAVSLEPVAAVASDRCVGYSRCGLCAPTCPTGAIGASDGTAAVGTVDCNACGRCLAACPTGAIRLAGSSPAQIEAELGTLLEEPGAGVLFACRASLDALDDERVLDDWALVEVPALSMVTPGWIAQTLLAGAPQVWLRPCGGDCCASWRDDGASIDLCRRLLGTALTARLTVADAAPPPAPLRRDPPRRPTLTEPDATVATLATLGAGLEIRHSGSRLGLVDLAAGCTTCGACAVACPTAALTLVEDDAVVSLRYDPRLCTGCGLCSRACPEHVLHAERGLSSGRLAGGPLELASTALRRCRSCGEPMPAQAVAVRNRALLAERWPLLPDVAPDLCLACACGDVPRVRSARL